MALYDKTVFDHRKVLDRQVPVIQAILVEILDEILPVRTR